MRSLSRLVAPLIMFSPVALATPAAPDIRATVVARTEAAGEGHAERRLIVDVTIANETTTSAKLGGWLVFTDCELRSPNLRISDANGKPLSFAGAVGQLDGDHYELIPPGGRLTVRGLDIT